MELEIIMLTEIVMIIPCHNYEGWMVWGWMVWGDSVRERGKGKDTEG
jgi:hypothetical protein